jgi:3-hydroxy-9,10-secoandrosta-1,3,5(10)-triene-9,17-dione monooxygenase reductase component
MTESVVNDGAVAASAAFRAACAQFATGVVVVTTSTPAGDFGATVNAFTALTLEPPQVLLCLARTSTTWTAIEEAGVFAVNVLAADQVALARLFATKQPDKFARTPVTASRGAAGAPLIEGALCTLECTLAETFEKDTHVVLIGRVAGLRHDPAKAPALFFRSQLYEGFAAAATPGQTVQPLGSEPRSQHDGDLRARR